jgi:hypothetical protein
MAASTNAKTSRRSSCFWRDLLDDEYVFWDSALVAQQIGLA